MNYENKIIEEEDYEIEKKKLYDNLKKNLIESGDIATQTLANLYEQGEEIKKIDDGIDKTDMNVEKSGKILKNISFMKNMFGYFTKKKNKSKKDINMEASNELYQKNNNMSNKRTSLIIENLSKNDKKQTKEMDDIDEIGNLTRRIVMMSHEMGGELVNQNEFIDNVITKVDTTDYKVKRLNKTIRKI